jgi:polysaccharide export outer membrane protein
MRTACKRILLPLVAIAFTMLMGSCGSTKNVAYLQNSDEVDLTQSQYLYDARIMPKDQLTITVSTTDAEAAIPFNLTVPTPYTVNQRSSYSQAMLQMYLVDNDGNINFPIIGQIHLGGKTKAEAEQMIQEKIRPYMADSQNPIVTVRMSTYQISVLGEVARPGSFSVSREKITILEALAQAGDLTIYGQRENVKLIREDAQGRKTIYEINLNDANLINLPYYYLQQNDVIYVTPNKVKAQNSSVGSMTTLWFSATSILISLTSLLYNILK